MTKTFESNDRNDLVIGTDGNLSIVSGLRAVALNCRSAMQAQRGEMLFAADRGIPTLGTVWNAYLPAQFEAAARVAIKRVAGVVAVTGFTIDRTGEAFGYTATIQTIYGETTANAGL
jgi:hypothetical protein